MVKLAIFVPSLNGGGAERSMVTLANAIALRGFSVDLVLAYAEGPYLKDISPSVRVVDLKARRVILALWPLVCYLRKERPIAMLSALGHSNVVALLARKLAHISTRMVVSERGFISGEYNLVRGISAHIIFYLIPFLYRSADGICAVSKEASKDLANFIGIPFQRVQTIYNPFDLERIKILSAEQVNHSWLEPGQPPLVVAIGRLNEAKDFSVLIRAFAHMRQQYAARLIILGEGELRSELESLLEHLNLGPDVVQLPGFVSNPYVWLARCNLFVLSSRREGLPGALIEAMACGAPVVSTNCRSGPDEILDSGRWGRIVPVGDVEGLASAMALTIIMPAAERPNVRLRAADFEQDRAVDAYLRILGLPIYANKEP